MTHQYLDEVMRNKPYFLEPSKEWKFWKQRRQYGFDQRETYALNDTFYCWLYERLRMYVDKASKIIDLEYHRFTWKGKEYTQLDLIRELLTHLEFYFKSTEDCILLNLEEEKIVREIGEIWAILLPAMWW